MYNLPQQTLDSFQGHSLEGEKSRDVRDHIAPKLQRKMGWKEITECHRVALCSKFPEISYDLGYYIWPKNIRELACRLHRFLLAYRQVSLTWKTKTSNVLYSVLTAPIAGWRPGMLFNLCGLEFHYLYQYLFY